MNLKNKPIKNWFGFTRRERRSTFIMLLIIILMLGLRYTIPDSKIVIEDITGTMPDEVNHSDLSGKDSLSTNNLITGNIMNSGKTGSAYIKKAYGIEGKRIPFEKNKQTPLQKVSNYPRQKNLLIEINRSDSATLIKLPGIGPVLSARIIKYRRLLGGYASTDQLREVYGLSVETYELIKCKIFADSSMITKININSAGYKELSHIHYFEKYEVTAILKYREIKGRIKCITDLTENKLITPEKAGKVGPYLRFDN
jgi:DNA uptake protein and related DNA-binding proteins